MASESIAHSAFGLMGYDSEPIRAREIIVKYPETMTRSRPKFWRKSTRRYAAVKNIGIFGMNNTTIIEFGSRKMWKPMQTCQGV